MLTQQCLVSFVSEFFPYDIISFCCYFGSFSGCTYMEQTKLENLQIDIHRQNHLKAIFVYEISLYKVELSSFLISQMSWLQDKLSWQHLVLMHINRGGKNKSAANSPTYLKLIWAHATKWHPFELPCLV